MSLSFSAVGAGDATASPSKNCLGKLVTVGLDKFGWIWAKLR